MKLIHIYLFITTRKQLQDPETIKTHHPTGFFFKFAKGSVFIAECRETCKQAEHVLMTAGPVFEW